MSNFIEDRHEVKLKRRIADIRPWTEKAAEALSDRFILGMWFMPLIVFSAMVPLVALLLLPVALGLVLVHRNVKPLLPMRYPAMNPEPDPVTGKRGDGIMFFGNQESSSVYEKFKEIWGNDDALRRHLLILGSTGSGKSELLKALFFNALCWSSGFFIADGKADNKLPTDVFTMVRSVGIEDNYLTLNFLLAGKTPEQVRRSRTRRTNKLNPFTSADADTIIQMGANMLPKVEGDGKNWQEKALNLWRAQVMALCYKRDTHGFDLSVSTLVEYMSLSKIEELYLEGYDEFKRNGEWSYGFIAIKTYLDSGCPSYRVDKLLAKHRPDDMPGAAPAAGAFGKPPPKAGANDQDNMASEQHAYRTSQLMPVLNLLDKTYAHIFRDKYPEIDMVDVTLNNRIMTMLIPSLEKSASEAENLGKLAVACLRVMMSRNLGGGVEGSRLDLLESKATNSTYPYLVALDELGYYFSDGLAVIFAQARSLGFSMVPAAQDLEKLTEGSRAAEAYAMIANAVTKIFLRIDDAKKTYELVQGTVQKAKVAVYRNFEITGMGWSRKTEVDIEEIDRVSMPQLQAFEPGQGIINALGRTTRFRSYYMDGDLKKHKAENFYVLRFLQVPPPTHEEVRANSIDPDFRNDPLVKGERMRSVLAGQMELPEVRLDRSEVIDAVAAMASSLSPHVAADMRGMALYEAARRAVLARKRGQDREANALGLAPGSAVGLTRAGQPPRGAEDEPVRPLAQRQPAARPVTTFTPPAASDVDLDAALDFDAVLGGGGAATPGGAFGRAGLDSAVQPPGDQASLGGGNNGLSWQPTQRTTESVRTEQEEPDLDEIDLDALMSPQPPFERKAIETLARADELDRGAARPATSPPAMDAILLGLAPRQPSADRARPSPFAKATASRPAPPSAHASASPVARGADDDLAAVLRADDALASAPAAASTPPMDEQDPFSDLVAEVVANEALAKGVDAAPIYAPGVGEEDWIQNAVSAVQTLTKDSPERTAVGFRESTTKSLSEIESVLGNPEPEKSIGALEAMMSAQVTPALSPEVPADEWMLDEFLDNFESTLNGAVKK